MLFRDRVGCPKPVQSRRFKTEPRIIRRIPKHEDKFASRLGQRIQSRTHDLCANAFALMLRQDRKRRQDAGDRGFAGSVDGEFMLTVAPQSGRVPRDDWIEGPPLLVSKLATGELWLTWLGSCMPWDDDYSIYMGTIGLWGLHEPLTCSTGGATNYFMGPPGDSSYFIVAPNNGVSEGSHGTQRFGQTTVERPPSPAECYLYEVGECP